MEKNIQIIADELNVRVPQVQATLSLLDEGGTVPFISRYRKEVTGSLDEVAIAQIRDRIAQLRELDKRRESILKTIDEQGKLTDELKEKIEKANTLAELEDLYLPYKPKRKTRATIAKEKGLEPFAEQLLEGKITDLESLAQTFIDEEKGVKNADEAIAGARDIVAEHINEDQECRKEVRQLFEKKGTFKAKVIPGKEDEGLKYKDYFDWSEDIQKAPSHRVLAMRRAEKEMIISLDCTPEEEDVLWVIQDKYVEGSDEVREQLKIASKDAYRRLLKPSMETEIRLSTKHRADEDAINVFAENLRQLLLAAPLGQKNVLALDPGFRTGCKLVCLDRQGKLLFHTAIYPNPPQNQVGQSKAVIEELCQRFDIEAIAIGNGTASRETENIVRGISSLPKSIEIVVVNESGASIYSASDVAREEFPNEDVTVRGAVSIGRRLMDPLAELVKIDPKSIGVGQYQHDVDQSSLKNSLDDVVMSCVNAIGVEVNTASKELLTYVSGLGPTIAKNIVEYRNTNGAFKSRSELKKVPRLGPKAYEQCAGFLKIRDAKNPLDASSVHPESYEIVKTMAKDQGCTVADLIKDKKLREQVDLKKYVTDTIGMPTLTDIMKELDKPGHDPREQFEAFQFAEGVDKPEDLYPGMKLPGIVTNITNFGAFVDVGVHQDGLVHLSELSDQYVEDPNEIVKVHQKVDVTVLEVDLRRNRISLSMKGQGQKSGSGKRAAGKKRTERPQQQQEDTSNMSMEEKLKMLQSKFK